MRDDVQDLITRLEKNMERITWGMMDCETDDLATAPDEGEWSPIQIFAHMKASNDITTGRIPLLVTHVEPTLQNVDGRAWATLAGYEEAPLDQTLMAYRRQRDETLWQLRRLPDDCWDRVAHHETRGELTLFTLLQSFLEHEEEHITQLEAVFGDEADEGAKPSEPPAEATEISPKEDQ